MKLEQLLEKLGEAGNGDSKRVTIGSMIQVVGERSFAPLLVFAGLLALSPLSGIPGMPTLVATIVLLTSGQLLFGREHFWLPDRVLRQGIPRERFDKALKMARPASRFVDRILRPRLTALTRGIGTYLIAVACLLIAVTMPPLEILPFAASIAGAAIATFGLSLMARDGLMALVALVFSSALVALVLSALV